MLAVLVVVVLVLLVVVATRLGQRSYQRYSGLQHQRGAAKRSREAGTDRLKTAERLLVEAQRALVEQKEHDQAQAIERLRTQLATLADRLRYATYGYSPIGSPTPVREAELAELQARDAETITDAQRITELAGEIAATARTGDPPDLGPLESSLGQLRAALDRRRAVS